MVAPVPTRNPCGHHWADNLNFTQYPLEGITRLNGGYDEGYESCACFWGSAGSSKGLYRACPFKGLQVLELGCGEGKNAHAFARAGANVVAVDCSESAITNGQREFVDANINWVLSDAETYLSKCDMFDVIIMYGLLHCLSSLIAITSMIRFSLHKTRMQGHHIIASFNDGPHNLTAHPGFLPTLASHDFYLRQYAGHEILSVSNALLHETHPHNGIPHFHSLTRLVARKTQ